MRWRSMFLLACLVAALPARAELGPVDGAGLAPTEVARVQPGGPAPDFSLESADGAVVTLSALRGKADVVLVFYRGHW